MMWRFVVELVAIASDSWTALTATVRRVTGTPLVDGAVWVQAVKL